MEYVNGVIKLLISNLKLDGCEKEMGEITRFIRYRILKQFLICRELNFKFHWRFLVQISQ